MSAALPKPGSNRGLTQKGPSPILIPGELKPGRFGGLGTFFGKIFYRHGKVPRFSPTVEASEGSDPGPAAPEAKRTHGDTVQFLPGRLEPLIPEVMKQEVRFQQASSGDQEVTLGWETGEPPHHVTLDHTSIQPLHAKMTFQKGSWMIESLAPNSLIDVNGTPVPTTSGPYLLANGDQVRIGEALFRFHMP